MIPLNLTNGRTHPGHLPHDWRVRVPQPVRYFAMHVPGLSAPSAHGGAQGKCPLHEDEETSLNVNLNTGHWQCRSCGQGTLVDFHQRLTAKTWVDAVLDLIERVESEQLAPAAPIDVGAQVAKKGAAA